MYHYLKVNVYIYSYILTRFIYIYIQIRDEYILDAVCQDCFLEEPWLMLFLCVHARLLC